MNKMSKLNTLLEIRYFDFLLPLVAYLAISLIVLNGILLSPGTIGFFHDWFIGPFPEMNELWSTNGLYVWDGQLGDKLYGTDWVIRLVLAPFSFLGGEAISKGLLVLCMTFSGFGAFCLGKRFHLSPYVSLVAGILYIFSPLIFTRIIAGYIYYMIAYFLSPLIVESFLKGKQENNNRHFIVGGLLLSFALIQLQFLPMIILILVIFTVFDLKRIKKSIAGLSIIISISILITLSPLLLAQFAVKSSDIGIPFSPEQLLSYFTVTTASDLAKSFRLLGYEGMPYSYLNLGTETDPLTSNHGIIPSWIFYLDFLLPVFGFSVLLFRRDKYAVSLAVISVIGLYFLKGSNTPFSGVFIYLFIHGFYIFREVWHTAFLYNFAITFLITFFLGRIWQIKLKEVYRLYITVPLVILIVVSNGYPLLLGNFAGYLQTYNLPDEYHSLYNKFLLDYRYNSLILPYVNPIQYDNLRLEGVDPLISYSPTMIFTSDLGNKGSPTLGASIWLLSTIQENRTNNLGNLLTGFGIKYVILRNEFVSNYPDYTTLGGLDDFRDKWYASLEPVFSSQKDIKLIYDDPKYKIYENVNNVSKIFTPMASMGGLSDFDTLIKISNITPLANVAVYPTINGNNSLVFMDDLQENTIPVNDFVPVGGYSKAFDPRNGWTDSRASFGHDRVLTTRVNVGSFTKSPNSELSFELPSRYKGEEVEIWLKALAYQKGGAVSIQINGNERVMSLFSQGREIQLFKIFEGELPALQKISIKNIKGTNYVEGLYIKNKVYDIVNNVNNVSKISLTNIGNTKGENLLQNPDFSILSNKSGLPLGWNDTLKSCENAFTCKLNDNDGWDDRQSFQITTQNQSKNKWTWISGSEVNVKTNEKYELQTHMKLNDEATQSHILLQGYNNGTDKWYQIKQCPPGTNGPLEWSFLSCSVTIPENTTKIRPILNAGWSSQTNKVAITSYDSININKESYEKSKNADQIKSAISTLKGNISPSIKEFSKINPSLWKVELNTSKSTTIGFAEPFDQRWQASIYKDGKKIQVVRSMPLYSVLNSFEINHTGDIQVVLEFLPQYWYQIGLIISAFTFIVCILYIVYDVKRKKTSKPAQPAD